MESQNKFHFKWLPSVYTIQDSEGRQEKTSPESMLSSDVG